MGIDISHSLLVGCSYDELEDFIAKEVEAFEAGGDEADEEQILDDHFCSASPYYDADRNYASMDSVFQTTMKLAKSGLQKYRRLLTALKS